MSLSTAAPPAPSASWLFCRGSSYVDLDAWHRHVDDLRSDEPFIAFEDRVFGRLHAAVSLDVVLEVSRRQDEFANTEEPALLNDQLSGDGKDELWAQLKMLLNQEGEEHLAYRGLIVDWFKNSTVKLLAPAVDDLVDESLGRLRELGGECDFATEIALPLPLRVIMSMLGVPREDEPVLLKLTQEMFSSDDDELGSGDPVAAMHEVAGYFLDLMKRRKDQPTDDLASAIANGTIDGTPMETLAALGLYVILATAGHDTTSFALSGGIDALCRFPDAFDRLRADPGLIPNAVNEIVRYTSPVRHFTRTARVEASVAGQRLRPGDRIFLSYPAANRDPVAFADPHRFDPARTNANRHVGWGHGPHYCLGARLAAMEINAVLTGLTQQFRSIESAGPAQFTKAHFVGGAKHVPIRTIPAAGPR